MVKQEKLKKVEDLANLIGKYPIIGIVNMHKTPSKAIQTIKGKLDDKALIKVAKKTIILFALDKLDKKDLKEKVGDQPALILTEMNPFKLYNFLQRNKSPASAKPGDVPEENIEVKSGPTDLMPGPAISTLTKVKIPAKVEAGKIAIMKDKVVCKAGEEVSEDMASALQLLKLEPMQIGLNVAAIYDNGVIYTGDQLYFDLEGFLDNVSIASTHAVSLAINSGYPTKETIEILLNQAYQHAKALESGTKPEPKKEVKEELVEAKEQSEKLKEKVEEPKEEEKKEGE
jgi:large subunit ribosomal protein L10